MTTIIIELNKLDADPKNVRKTYSTESIAALAGSIKVNGVLQNLVVRTADKKGRYFVTAGERRRRALLLLLEQGEIQKNHAAECKVRDGEDATEISLTENVMREDMHPVDAYEAFSALAEQGKARRIADFSEGEEKTPVSPRHFVNVDQLASRRRTVSDACGPKDRRNR